MKKILGAIIIVLIIGGLGGLLINRHGLVTNDAATAISAGRQHVSEQRYGQAVVNFKQALDSQPNNQVALRGLQQVQAMQLADQFYAAQHFVTAINQYQRVVRLNQLPTLVQRAKQQLQISQQRLNGAIELTNTYNQALRLNHAAQYQQSLRAMQPLFQSGNLNNPYFKIITERIKRLRNANGERKLDPATVTNRLAIRPQTVNLENQEPTLTN